MPNTTITEASQHGICRICSQPITRKGKLGWYHDARNLGAERGIRPHFAEPMTRAVA